MTRKRAMSVSSTSRDHGAETSAGRSVAADNLGNRLATHEERLAMISAKLGLRAAEWGWSRLFERWRSGEPLSAFQRKFLAVSAHYRAAPGERVYDHLTVARIRPLPERSR